jgi:enamine deaminase RidA (YjgF/YER057c/UK114 family)
VPAPPPPLHPRNALGTPSPAAAVKHGPYVFIAGQTLPADCPKSAHKCYEEQAAIVLQKLDAQLVAAGTHKHNLLSVRVYLKDTRQGAAGFNKVWGRRRQARCSCPAPAGRVLAAWGRGGGWRAAAGLAPHAQSPIPTSQHNHHSATGGRPR